MGQATPAASNDIERSGGPAAIVFLVALIVVCIGAAVTVGLVLLPPGLADLREADAELAAAGESAATAEAVASSSAQEVREMRVRWQGGAADLEAVAFVDAHICEVATEDLETTRAALDALVERTDPALASQAAWQSALESPEVAAAYDGCGSGGTT